MSFITKQEPISLGNDLFMKPRKVSASWLYTFFDIRFFLRKITKYRYNCQFKKFYSAHKIILKNVGNNLIMICINMKRRPLGHITHPSYTVNCDPGNLLIKKIITGNKCESLCETNILIKKAYLSHTK